MNTQKKMLFLLFFTFFCNKGMLKANNSRLIVLNFSLPPQEVIDLVNKDLARERGLIKIDKWRSAHPPYIAKRILKGITQQQLTPTCISGIIAFYTSYYNYSSRSGILSFPLRHNSSELTLIVTPFISLKKLEAETYSYLFISKNDFEKNPKSQKMRPVTYDLSFTQDSEQASWSISKSATPLDQKLPKEAIIIISNPANIYMPEGKISVASSLHMTPPPLYVVGTKYNQPLIFNSLNIVPYFEEITIASDISTTKNSQEIEQNAILND